LVLETFRPLALGAAEVAADLTLTAVPATIASREDGLRVVEAIELLLDADQWEAAYDLYRLRTHSGQVWKWLPAARLGQRAASAFVATPARQQACHAQLPRNELKHFLAAVGVYGVGGGDLITAREYLEAAAHHFEGPANWASRSILLRNLAECLLWLGDVEFARRAAAEAADEAVGDPMQVMKAKTYQGHMAMVAGDSGVAEGHFLAADLEHLYIKRGKHLYALGGVWWGEFLARTSRSGPSRRLTDHNREIVADLGWNEDVARCDRLLARLDMADMDLTTAEQRLTAAAATFRDGDVLLELAETLPVLAECARASGDLEAAARHVDEALNITGPRGLLRSHATALTVRARICADQVAAGSRQYVESGRDAADAAHRIATRRQMAWQWLDALDAHARLDQVEGINRGWAQQAATLRARLTPVELDPDPLATIQRQVTEKRARGKDYRQGCTPFLPEQGTTLRSRT